jgi:hypothetical protein
MSVERVALIEMRAAFTLGWWCSQLMMIFGMLFMLATPAHDCCKFWYYLYQIDLKKIRPPCGQHQPL